MRWAGGGCYGGEEPRRKGEPTSRGTPRAVVREDNMWPIGIQSFIDENANVCDREQRTGGRA